MGRFWEEPGPPLLSPTEAAQTVQSDEMPRVWGAAAAGAHSPLRGIGYSASRGFLAPLPREIVQ